MVSPLNQTQLVTVIEKRIESLNEAKRILLDKVPTVAPTLKKQPDTEK